MNCEMKCPTEIQSAVHAKLDYVFSFWRDFFSLGSCWYFLETGALLRKEKSDHFGMRPV